MDAKISKKQPWKVVCGVRDCGAHLAWIVESRQDPPRRWLVLEPDWSPRYADRVWAKRRERTRGRGDDHRQFWHIQALPVEIACGTCGLRQVLNNNVLQVAAADMRTFPGIATTCPTASCKGQVLPGGACSECKQINTRKPDPGFPMEIETLRMLLADTQARYAATNT